MRSYIIQRLTTQASLIACGTLHIANLVFFPALSHFHRLFCHSFPFHCTLSGGKARASAMPVKAALQQARQLAVGEYQFVRILPAQPVASRTLSRKDSGLSSNVKVG